MSDTPKVTEEHLTGLRKLVSCFANPHTEAWDEMFAQASYAAVLAASRYDPSKGASLSTWINSYAKHMILDVIGCTEGTSTYKWKKRVCLVPGYEDFTTPHQISQLSIDPQDRDEVPYCHESMRKSVQRALKSLHPRDRAIFYGYFAQGKTGEELAREQGISRQRVNQIIKSRIGRVRDKLRECLPECGLTIA